MACRSRAYYPWVDIGASRESYEGWNVRVLARTRTVTVHGTGLSGRVERLMCGTPAQAGRSTLLSMTVMRSRVR
jgi:hypothetical protein